jgi:hypothetical protein
MRRNRAAETGDNLPAASGFFTSGITGKTVSDGCCFFATSKPATYKFLGKSRDVRVSAGCAPKVHNRPRIALRVPLPPRQPLRLNCAWKARYRDQ